MHSVAIVSVLAAAAGLTVAAPAQNQPRSGYYVCASNNFRGTCSVDACNLAWCPDYQPYTYIPVGSTGVPPVVPPVVPVTPGNADPTVCPAGTGYFQSCGTNGFRGCCKSDACGGAWCPDYKPGSYTPVNTWTVKTRSSDPTVCAPGTGYFQSCGTNGFRGCCKSDACGSAWCADYKVGTYELVGSATPETPVSTPETPVSKPETPVAVPETPVVHPAGWTDPTVCAPGTGYFQKCSNGFSGCCKQDACSIGWCPN